MYPYVVILQHPFPYSDNVAQRIEWYMNNRLPPCSCLDEDSTGLLEDGRSHEVADR